MMSRYKKKYQWNNNKPVWFDGARVAELNSPDDQNNEYGIEP
jgi:hypothetical protein